MNTEDPSPDSQPDKLAQLLAQAGPRHAPPPRIEAEVRAAVHAEWQHLIQTRKARQRRYGLAAAGVLFAVLGGSWLARTLDQPAPGNPAAAAMIAVITYSQGGALLNGTVANEQRLIHDGDTLHTGAGGVRIRLNNGISMRVAADSSLRWTDIHHAQLSEGRLYVDSHANAAALAITTAQGVVTHLGTRYFIAAEPQTLRVAVRNGRVAIHAVDTQLSVTAMEQLQLDADRQIVRRQLGPDDARWQWAAALAEPFTLENRSVSAYLQWVADETGYELHYASSALKTAADHTILHGQQATPGPLQSLQTVLGTTDFRASTAGRQLHISPAQ